MQVKNYYALSEPELDRAIADIREWLFSFSGHEDYPRVSFALDVALNAKEIQPHLEKDEFLKSVVDFIC